MEKSIRNEKTPEEAGDEPPLEKMLAGLTPEALEKLAVDVTLDAVNRKVASETNSIMQSYALKNIGRNNPNLAANMAEFEEKFINEKIDGFAKNLKIDLKEEKLEAKKALESESNMRDWIRGNVMTKINPYTQREGGMLPEDVAKVNAIFEFSADMLIWAHIEKSKSLSCYR